LHKQDANRVLNPWQWIDAVVTAGEAEWQAFFALRCHELADPKIQRIAEMIWAEIEDSVPFRLSDEETLWASAGACARVSYRCFDGTHSDTENAALGRRLANEKPAHASPLEHVLQAATVIDKQPGPVCGRWWSLRQIEGV
jgi:thymidylate synthase ThyX